MLHPLCKRTMGGSHLLTLLTLSRLADRKDLHSCLVQAVLIAFVRQQTCLQADRGPLMRTTLSSRGRTKPADQARSRLLLLLLPNQKRRPCASQLLPMLPCCHCHWSKRMLALFVEGRPAWC